MRRFLRWLASRYYQPPFNHVPRIEHSDPEVEALKRELREKEEKLAELQAKQEMGESLRSAGFVHAAQDMERRVNRLEEDIAAMQKPTAHLFDRMMNLDRGSGEAGESRQARPRNGT